MARVWTVVAACLALVPIGAAQRVITVRAHPSLAEPIGKIAEEFQKARKDVKVELVPPGKPADVVLGPASMVGKQAGARIFAIDRMVVVAQKEPERVVKFAHLGLTIRLAMPAIKTPEGALAAQILDQARNAYGRDWWANAKRNTTISAMNSEEAVSLVAEEKADAALVLSSTVHDAKVRIVPVPPDLSRSIEQYVYGRSDSLSQNFVEFLYSKGNQQRLVAAGFASPLSPVGELVVTYPGSMTKLFTAALGSLSQESVKSPNEGGKMTTYKGASLKSIIANKGTQVRFTAADGTALSLPLATLRRQGAVLAPMGDGNYRVIIAGRPVGKGLRWVRRIEVK